MSDIDDSIADIESELEQIEEMIENEKTKYSQADGAEIAHVKRLKDEFGLDSLEEAEEAIKIGEEELESDLKKLSKEFAKLKEACGI